MGKKASWGLGLNLCFMDIFLDVFLLTCFGVLMRWLWRREAGVFRVLAIVYRAS